MASPSSGPLLGLHHVTATVDEAQPDVDFCVEALGLRLLKKTVNFDNHHVYHFYYGTERGEAGTIWTTFPYHGRAVPVGRKGAGQVTVTSFAVPAGSLEFWRTRLTVRGLTVQDVPPRFGAASILVHDPSGLNIELIASEGDSRPAWMGGGVAAEAAIRGLHSVSMVVRWPAATIQFMTRALGFEAVDEMEGRVRLAVGGRGPGHLVDVISGPESGPESRPGMNGLGTVHHVAFAVADGDEQVRVRRELLRLGHQVTEVLDRQYFTSIYFREPGGVLFEIATVPPGFTVDEPLHLLGQSLKLPPWEEEERAEIERGLAPITLPTVVHS